MKWFRHFSNARTSEKLKRLKDKLGLKGYGQYWSLFELMNEQYDGNSTFITLHFSEISHAVDIKFGKSLQTFLQELVNFELISLKVSGKFYEIDCPMLFELMDKDSKYNRKKPALSSLSANNRYKNKEVEEDNTIPIVPLNSESENFEPGKFLNVKKILSSDSPQENLKEVYPRFTPDHFTDLWNEFFGERLKRISGIGGGKHRDNFLKSLEFLPTEKHWRDLFELCLNTPKVMGSNDIGWTVTPTWIVDYDNAIKIINGDFDDAKHIKNLFASMNTTSSEAV